MAKGRSLSLEMPKYLLDQIQQRAFVNGRKRNAEIRYLVDLGDRYSGGLDCDVRIPTREEAPWVQTVCRLEVEVYQMIEERSDENHRSKGFEVVRLVAYAIEEMARRDLAVISEMMSNQGRASPSAPRTAAT